LSAKRAWLWAAERGVGRGAHSRAGCVAPPCRAGAGSTPRTPTRPAPPARTRPCGCRGAFAPPRGPAGRWPPPAVPAGVAAVKTPHPVKNSWAGCRVESALHCTHARTHHTATKTPTTHSKTAAAAVAPPSGRPPAGRAACAAPQPACCAAPRGCARPVSCARKDTVLGGRGRWLAARPPIHRL
jgi:hypothetical protein